MRTAWNTWIQAKTDLEDSMCGGYYEPDPVHWKARRAHSRVEVLRRSRQQTTAVPMASDIPAQSDTAMESSSLALALRDGLLPALLLVRANGRATLTPEALRILGLRSNQIEMDLEDLPGEVAALVREGMRTRTPANRRRLEWKTAEGSARKVQASTCPAGAGAEMALAVALHDLPMLEGIELPLLRADRLANLGTLSAGVAHELKNALVPCKTFIDLLLETNPGSELGGLMQRELSRMQELISRILKISSPESAPSGPVALHQVLDVSLRVLQSQLAAKSITVTRKFEAASDVIVGHANELQQVFMNLLLNAFDAVGAEGTIVVRTRALSRRDPTQQRSEIAVSIEDNGAGIPPEIRGRLFEPFFTTKPEGTGLGLAIAQRIVRTHKGRIVVENAASKGTVFTVFLPG